MVISISSSSSSGSGVEGALVQAALLLDREERRDVQAEVGRDAAHRGDVLGRGNRLAVEEPQSVAVESLGRVQALAVRLEIGRATGDDGPLRVVDVGRIDGNDPVRSAKGCK